MRQLLLATIMLLFGLAITFGTASVLQDAAVAWSKRTQSGSFEAPDLKPTTTKLRAASQFADH